MIATDDKLTKIWLEKRMWPWPMVVAHHVASVLPTEAFDMVVGILDHYPKWGGASAEYTGTAAMGHIASALGHKDAEAQNQALLVIEEQILAALERGELNAWGRREEDARLERISPSDWVGGEISYRRDCRLGKAGARSEEGNFFGGEPIVWFYDVHVERLANEAAASLIMPATLPGVLPASAKPNDHRYADLAREAAKYLREDPTLDRAKAIRRASPDEDGNTPAKHRAIRHAFDLMFEPNGKPL